MNKKVLIVLVSVVILFASIVVFYFANAKECNGCGEIGLGYNKIYGAYYCEDCYRDVKDLMSAVDRAYNDLVGG